MSTPDPYASLGTPVAPSASTAAPSDPYAALGTPVAANSSSSSEPATGATGIGADAASVPDVLLHLASGAVSPILAGWRGLATLATGGGLDAAANAVNSTEAATTYQPRTAWGQDAARLGGKVMQTVLGRPVNYVSDKAADVGGPVAGTVVKTALEGAPLLLGGGAGAIGSVAGDVGDSLVADDMATGAAAPEAAAPAASEGVTAAKAAPNPQNAIGAAADNPPEFKTAPPPIATASDASAAESAPGLSAAEQAARKQTLSDVGLDTQRDSAITGNRKAAATFYQNAKVDSKAGNAAAAQLDKERAALGAHLDKLAADAGGSSGVDEVSLYNRGTTILQPFEDLKQGYNARIKQLYQDADAQAQGAPVEMPKLQRFLQGNRSAFLGTTEGKQLLEGTLARAKELGLLGPNETFNPATAAQAEALRQYVGDNWTPRTSKLAGQLQDTIDQDVMESTGRDSPIYAQARALRRQRAVLLDEPKGVASLLKNSGPGGINRAVDIEKVPDTVARLPVDHFDHVVTTLQRASADPALQPQAQAALGEIRSQMLARLKEQAEKFKGMWNNRGVTQYLNANRAKFARVFSPAELDRLRTLNDAGNILDIDRQYPGAAAQGHNLAMKGVRAAATHVPGAIASMKGGAVGLADDIAGAPIREGIGRAFDRMTLGRGADKVIKVNPAVKAQMEQVLAHPNASRWLTASKTTAKYLRMMAALRSREELMKAAEALNRAGQREGDQDAVEAAQAVRSQAQRQKADQMTFRHFSNANGAPQRLTVNPTRVEQAGGPQVSAAYAVDHPDQMVEPAHRGKPEYRITVPKSSMYDLSSDPEGIREAATKGGVYDHSAAEQAVKQRGYTGYYTPAHANPVYRGQARFFKPVDATRKQ